MTDPDPDYAPGPHRSDDAPARAPRKPRERGKFDLTPTDSEGVIARAVRATTCKGCGELLDLAAPESKPMALGDANRGTVWLSYACVKCSERKVIHSADVSRYCRTIGLGHAPAVLENLRRTLLLTMASMASAHKEGDHATSAKSAMVVARLGDLLLTVAGVKKNQIEVEHSGSVTVRSTAEARAMAEAMAREYLQRTGFAVINGEIHPVKDAEVVEGGGDPGG